MFRSLLLTTSSCEKRRDEEMDVRERLNRDLTDTMSLRCRVNFFLTRFLSLSLSCLSIPLYLFKLSHRVQETEQNEKRERGRERIFAVRGMRRGPERMILFEWNTLTITYVLSGFVHFPLSLIFFSLYFLLSLSLCSHSEEKMEKGKADGIGRKEWSTERKRET